MIAPRLELARETFCQSLLGTVSHFFHLFLKFSTVQFVSPSTHSFIHSLIHSPKAAGSRPHILSLCLTLLDVYNARGHGDGKGT